MEIERYETFRGGTRSRAPVPPAPDFLFPVLIVIESRRQLDSYRSQFRWPENGRLYLATKTSGGGARTRSTEEEIHSVHRRNRLRVSSSVLPFLSRPSTPLNSSTTNPYRFSLPRQLLRAFTPITLDGFPPVPAFRLRKYGTIYIRNAIEAIDRAPFSFLSFFLYGDYRSSKVIENKRTLNEIVGATHVRFGFVDQGWKCRIFKFLSCEIMKERWICVLSRENCNSSCIISYKMSSKYKATTPAARNFFLSEDR